MSVFAIWTVISLYKGGKKHNTIIKVLKNGVYTISNTHKIEENRSDEATHFKLYLAFMHNGNMVELEQNILCHLLDKLEGLDHIDIIYNTHQPNDYLIANLLPKSIYTKVKNRLV